MTKLELTQRLAAVNAECEALRSENSRLHAQLSAQRAGHTGGHDGFKALMAQLKARTAKGERVKLVGHELVAY